MTLCIAALVSSSDEVVTFKRQIDATFTLGAPSTTLATAPRTTRPPARGTLRRTLLRGSHELGTLERCRANTLSCAATSEESRANSSGSRPCTVSTNSACAGSASSALSASSIGWFTSPRLSRCVQSALTNAPRASALRGGTELRAS